MAKMFSAVPWSLRTSLYEVNVRQYTPEGTFEAFSKHLPRLVEMGIEVLWFMPITPISVEKRQGTLGSYYACSDYTAINPEFGDLEDFRRLVADAHSSGLKVIIDWVANHTGYDHKWVKSNPEFYKKDVDGQFYDSNNWQDVIDLNYYDQHMRTEMIRSMRFWIDECDIDGFRCDMAHLVPLDFWRDARKELDSVKPLFWLAETEHPMYLEVFDCCYAWDFMHVSEKFIKRSVDLQALVKTLWKTQSDFPEGSFHLFFTSNHDENSWNGTEYEKYSYAAKALAVLAATWNGLPLIYSGQELPNEKRLKFFDKDEISWKAQPLLHDFYRELLSLRKRNAALEAGYLTTGTTVFTVNSSDVLVFERTQGDNSVLVILNFSDQDQKVQVPDTVAGSYRNIFEGNTLEIKLFTEFELRKGGYVVLEKV